MTIPGSSHADFDALAQSSAKKLDIADKLREEAKFWHGIGATARAESSALTGSGLPSPVDEQWITSFEKATKGLADFLTKSSLRAEHDAHAQTDHSNKTQEIEQSATAALHDAPL